jgi:hypothetical protein
MTQAGRSEKSARDIMNRRLVTAWPEGQNYTRPRVGPSSPFDPGLRLGEQEGWGLFWGSSFPTMIEADDCLSNGQQKVCRTHAGRSAETRVAIPTRPMSTASSTALPTETTTSWSTVASMRAMSMTAPSSRTGTFSTSTIKQTSTLMIIGKCSSRLHDVSLATNILRLLVTCLSLVHLISRLNLYGYNLDLKT